MGLRLPRALFSGNQKYLSLNLADTAENLLVAEMKSKQIELDIIAGYFDVTLAKYKPKDVHYLRTPSFHIQ
ncbi:Arm DNA-binding domain-containing protein [Anabaena sp. CCY 0017]|uniref:Arm DNA-binding domain-containing protein n=1 Tax=Anabaena sp. CCY 0017 TaxID=3103866 RepID=UPI0039C5D030